ncbi:MAG: tyrosine--tRNA ligase [Elusimicrobiota bacterium]|jgi:tyrosyl-tRNA synthetase
MNALEALKRGTVELVSEEDLSRKLKRGTPLRVKLGVDPTSPDLHLGHTVALSKLRAFQDLGHTAVLIIGDFTARIGDPSGRDATRPTLDAAAVQANARTYTDQAFKVLDKSRTEVRFNSEWLEPFVRERLLSELRRHTVGQLLEREDFRVRMKDGTPITLLEMMYPLMQGYDSVAIKADVELGGNDQLFNLLMGRAMQKDAGQEPQVVLTVPLLAGLDGVKKMSKSYGNAISLSESAREVFGKVMKLSDESMLVYYELLTARDLAGVKAEHPMAAKKGLAEELTARFHGAEAAKAERAFFDETFSKKKLPDDIPTAEAPKDAVGFKWSALLVELKLTASRKEAQRLIEQGGFRIDGEQMKKDDPIGPRGGTEVVLQVGKHRFQKVRFPA